MELARTSVVEKNILYLYLVRERIQWTDTDLNIGDRIANGLNTHLD